MARTQIILGLRQSPRIGEEWVVPLEGAGRMSRAFLHRREANAILRSLAMQCRIDSMKIPLLSALPIPFGLLLVTLMTLGAADATASLCIPNSGDINSGFEYIQAVTDVLVQVKLGRDELKEINKQQNDPNFATIFMTALKTSQQYYQCGISIIQRYEASSNEMISGGSTKMEESIVGLMNGNKYHLDEIRALLSGNREKNPAKKAEMDSDNQVAVDDAWKRFGMSTVTATWAVMSDPRKTGPSRPKLLVITANQKKQLIAKLEGSFGKKMKPKEDRVVEVMAGQLLKFLHEKWQTADASKSK